MFIGGVMSIALLVVFAIIGGALVGFGTELTLKSHERARNLPGGSLAIGVLLGTLGNGWVSLLTGGVFGFIGWLLYRALRPTTMPK